MRVHEMGTIFILSMDIPGVPFAFALLMRAGKSGMPLPELMKRLARGKMDRTIVYEAISRFAYLELDARLTVRHIRHHDTESEVSAIQMRLFVETVKNIRSFVLE